MAAHEEFKQAEAIRNEYVVVRFDKWAYSSPVL